MDAHRIAQGIAANVVIIAEAAANVAMIDAESHGNISQEMSEARVKLSNNIDKAKSSIAQWLIQPRSGTCAALAKAHRALDGDSNDDEHDALVQLVEAVEQGQ